MKKRNIFGLMMAAVLAFGFAACGDRNEIEGGDALLLTDGASVDIEAFMDHDPTAAYPMTVHITCVGNRLVVSGGQNHLTDEIINLGGVNSANTYGTRARIAEYDDATSLDAMDYNVAAGLEFDDEDEEIEANQGYVVKATAMGNLNQYNNPAIHDPADLYIRLFVTYNKKKDEYRLYYQYPFLPEE